MKKTAFLILCAMFLPFFAAAAVISIQNSSIGLNFADDSFEFNMGTSATYAPPNSALTYYYPYIVPQALETTHSVVNVDGTAYDFKYCAVDSGSVINGGTYISGSKNINGVIDANFRLEIVNNPVIGTPADTIKIKYTLTNISSAAHTVAVRLELDTMVVDQDGAIISIDNGFTTLASTTAWYKSLGQIPANWWDFNVNPTKGTPTLVGRGYTYNNPYDEAATEPDIMEVANWVDVSSDNQWSLETPGKDMVAPNDSAVVFWWCNGPNTTSSFTLAPGNYISFVTYYGLNKQPLLTTPTITPTFTITQTPTETYTLTSSPTFSVTPTITQTFTDTPTFTNSPTSTDTPTVTPTYTITDTFTDTPTATPTYTITDTFTDSPTPTITMTSTPTPPPFELRGKGNFPNPFISDTQIVYWLSTPAQTVKIMVYTVSGEKVFWDDTLAGNQGFNSFHWLGLNRANRPVASGVFIYRIDAFDDKSHHATVTLKAVCVK